MRDLINNEIHETAGGGLIGSPAMLIVFATIGYGCYSLYSTYNELNAKLYATEIELFKYQVLYGALPSTNGTFNA